MQIVACVKRLENSRKLYHTNLGRKKNLGVLVEFCSSTPYVLSSAELSTRTNVTLLLLLRFHETVISYMAEKMEAVIPSEMLPDYTAS